jgi:hypothetical protein
METVTRHADRKALAVDRRLTSASRPELPRPVDRRY